MTEQTHVQERHGAKHEAWVELPHEQIGELMLSALMRDGAFTMAGRPGLFFEGFECMRPTLECMLGEWQWRPAEVQGTYKLMQRSCKMGHVPDPPHVDGGALPPPAKSSGSEKPNMKLILSAFDTRVDTEEFPRPLRDPAAPRPAGSSIHGFYGNAKQQRGGRDDAYSVQAQNGDAEPEIPTVTREEFDSLVGPAETSDASTSGASAF